ncbi:MAG: RibD family protein, partial [Acidobacteria bacterium]|nr:RibD family protein [Acidobacteriota bacterium]
PYVTLKVAMSLDGKIATQTGQSQWITSGIARQKVQALRKMCDGILVGTQTLFVDRPRLTVHNGSEDDQPTRCFLDRKGRVPMDYFARAAELPGRKIVLHGQNLDPQRMQSLGEMGFETNQVPEEEGGFVLDRLLTQVADCGINHLLVEGGARLVNQLISQDLIQEIWLMIAPIVLAGQAPTWSGLPFGVNELSSAPRFQFKSSERLGSDLAILLERSL